jgi:predicted DNA-binding transcriptional regulator YafY
MHHAVTAECLAQTLDVSVRTIYRDVQHLVDTGVPIMGEAGVGYVIDKHYHLPPITFDTDEIEAIALGVGMVSNWTDETFARKALSAFEKIQATLAANRLNELQQICTFSQPSHYKIPWEVSFSDVRECIRRKHKIEFVYCDLSEKTSKRIIWPLALVSFSPVWLLAGWCELRSDFRSFRLDRIAHFKQLEARYPNDKNRNLAAYLVSVRSEQ